MPCKFTAQVYEARSTFSITCPFSSAAASLPSVLLPKSWSGMDTGVDFYKLYVYVFYTGLRVRGILSTGISTRGERSLVSIS